MLSLLLLENTSRNFFIFYFASSVEVYSTGFLIKNLLSFLSTLLYYLSVYLTVRLVTYAVAALG